MTCERGKCLVCAKEIAHPCQECGNAWKNHEDYTHVQVSWSNGSKMDVAVCADCAQGPIWRADKKEMTEAIWKAWEKQGARFDKEAVIV